MKKSLIQALPMAEAFTKLLYPFAEAVLHDLEKDCIEAIFNPFSKREVGDDSNLDRMEFDSMDKIIGPYEKVNWDGRPLKSISIILRNEKGKAEGFLCVNMDLSSFSSISKFLGNSLDITPDEMRLFQDDFYEKVNIYVQNYCQENQTSIAALNRENKQEIVSFLEKEGAFQSKNAATYIGRVLGISRATVYNYLKEYV